MKKTYKILSLLFGVILLITACEEDDRPYSSAQPKGETSAVFQVAKQSLELVKTDPQGVAHDLTSTITVQLYGAPLTTDANITLTVLDSSTAVQGEHFDFSAASLTIPAGEVSGSVDITLYNGYPYDEVTGESINGGLPLEEELVLYLKIGGDVSGYYTGDVMIIDIYERDFCAVFVDDIVGTWSGTDVDDYYGSSNVSCIIEKVDEETFVVRANDGVPVFCKSTFVAWGEVFQDGIGNEGDVYFTVDPEGNIESEQTYWGQTLPGPWDYYSTATGTYISCEKELRISFIVDDGWLTSETVLTKDN